MSEVRPRRAVSFPNSGTIQIMDLEENDVEYCFVKLFT
jgi:hypothetical protein